MTLRRVFDRGGGMVFGRRGAPSLVGVEVDLTSFERIVLLDNVLDVLGGLIEIFEKVGVRRARVLCLCTEVPTPLSFC